MSLKSINEALTAELDGFIMEYYQQSDTTSCTRWGSNPGYAFIGNQKLDIKVPRVCDTSTGKEISLKSYKALQNPSVIKHFFYFSNDLDFIFQAVEKVIPFRLIIIYVDGRWHLRNPNRWIPQPAMCSITPRRFSLMKSKAFYSSP